MKYKPPRITNILPEDISWTIFKISYLNIFLNTYRVGNLFIFVGNFCHSWIARKPIAYIPELWFQLSKLMVFRWGIKTLKVPSEECSCNNLYTSAIIRLTQFLCNVLILVPDAYWKHCQSPVMELLTQKSSIVDVPQDPNYASVLLMSLKYFSWRNFHLLFLCYIILCYHVMSGVSHYLAKRVHDSTEIKSFSFRLS